MKKKKKASTNEKADQFLAGLGTAGGAIGSPQLVGFGASDVQNQIVSGNTDEYANIRMRQEEIKIGESAAMPPDLDASYLKLNLPGSPLPSNGLLAPRNIVAAEQTQDMLLSQEQMFLAQYLPAAGLSRLPVGQPPLESGKGDK
mgnify:FL=1|jgi:hypothetical protein|tara:strand:- start:286 stop:717 length:432 start_codon:yes stop_codon:yes gene_type:complete